VIEAIIYLLFFAGSVFVAATLWRINLPALSVLAVVAGAMPFAQRLSLPSTGLELETQFTMWKVLVTLTLLAGVGMFLLCIYAGRKGVERTPHLVAVAIVASALLVLPVHRPHFGWTQHGHYVWESPFHVH
jgi:hypothetical protein